MINTNLDADQNGITANEFLEPGTYQGTGDDAYSVDYKGGRNGARGPNFKRLDLRAGYRLRLGGARTLDAFLDIFNLTNEPNFATPTGDLRSPNFLRITSTVNTSPTRTAQINLRYGF